MDDFRNLVGTSLSYSPMTKFSRRYAFSFSRDMVQIVELENVPIANALQVEAPRATPAPSRALITTPCQVWSRWTYILPYYSVFAADRLLYAVTLTFDPVTFTFYLWPWTFAVYSMWCGETLYQIWTQSSNPLRGSWWIVKKEKKTRTRNSSADEIAKVNFLYGDIVHAVQNTIHSCINSATDQRGRGYVLEHRFTKFSEITQCNDHYAVQGHSRSPIWLPIESSYDFLLVINTNLFPIFDVIADYCSNFGYFACMSPPPRWGRRGMYTVHLRLIGKLVVDFRPTCKLNFFSRCYGWGATSGYWPRLKIGVCKTTGLAWPKISGRRDRPH